MAYITVSEIRNRIPDISNLLNNRAEGTSEDDYISTAISDACGIINAYIGKVYPVPYPSQSPMLTHIAYLLVHYHLLRTNYYQESESSNEMIKEYYEQAMKYLDMIINGDIELDAQTVSGVMSNTENDKMVFTHTRRDINGNIIEIGTTENW